MVGIGGGSVAEDLAVDFGTPRSRVLHFFEHENRRPLRHDEAVAVGIEGP